MTFNSLKMIGAGAVTALLLAGCSSDPKLQSALLVTVKVDPLSVSSCVRVIVTPNSGGEAQATSPISRKDEIKVAVYRGAGWSNDVKVVARGYADCNADTALDAQIETSDTQASEFPGSGTASVVLNLKPGTTVVDADQDGDPATTDCDDNDPARFHGNAEACTDTVDHNCSNSTGCEDTACTGGCGNGGAGTCQGGTCVGGSETVGCSDGKDNDNDGLIDCADPDCAGQSCDDGNPCTAGDTCQSGVCSGPPKQMTCPVAPGSCASDAGVCNPQDGGCLYPLKAAGTACNDGNACTTLDKCQADGTCAPTGTPVSCSTPPNSQCFDLAGTCNPADAGCSYNQKAAGSSCSDSNLCTDTDVCLGDAGCAGTPKVCNTPPACKTPAGTCNSSTGQCSYTTNAANGSSCNDGNGCTQTDTCNAGNCVGANPKTCAPTSICEDAGTCTPATGACTNPQITCTPNECQTGGACVVGTGCTFTNKTDGTSCKGGSGSCQSGQCVPNYQPFTYTPSDFKADAGNPTTAVTIDCSTSVQTSAGSAQLNLCDGGVLPLQTITQTDNTTQAAFLAVKSFTMTSTAQLNVNGNRPFILGVYGDATVAGTINASASGTASGNGANSSYCPTASLDGDSSVATSGDTGGAGAGNFDVGGNGGNGNANTNHPTGGAPMTPFALVGGCSGGFGGTSATGNSRPKGGGGGGAIQISASGTLDFSATVAVAGGGGAGGKGGARAALYGEGGAGGGSAGTIVLEAQTLTLRAAARVTANGGSGGEGGNGSLTEDGSNGQDGSPDTKSTTPNGGDLANKGGNGGAGGGANTLNGGNGTNGANDSAGGGGGGGGGGAAGRIYLHANGALCRETNHVISPSNNNAPNGAFFIAATSSTTPATCP